MCDGPTPMDSPQDPALACTISDTPESTILRGGSLVSLTGRFFNVRLRICSDSTVCNIRTMQRYPESQSELIKWARGDRSQAEFARLLGCDRSCLSRYEREVLGAPPHVISKCLQLVAASLSGKQTQWQPFDKALTHVRQAMAELERLQAVSSRGVKH